MSKKPEISSDPKVLVADIKSLCMDRIEAKTADGHVLSDVFTKLEELLSEKKTK